MNSRSRCVAPITANCTNPARKWSGGRGKALSRSASPAEFWLETHPLQVQRDHYEKRRDQQPNPARSRTITLSPV